MFTADAKDTPYTQQLADAAGEIATLKAQIARLEKVIDGLTAQQLAGQHIIVGQQQDAAEQEDRTVDLSGNPDCDNEPAADKQTEGAATQDDCLDADASESCFESQPEPATTPASAPSSLPSAVRSLICRPTAAALTSKDDLTLIRGIDCTTGLQLAALDLSRFSDIAALDADGVARLKAGLAQPERIHKFNWIEQASVLANGELTAHARDTLKARKDSVGAACSNTHTAREATVADLLPMLALSGANSETKARDVPRRIQIELPPSQERAGEHSCETFIPAVAQSDNKFLKQTNAAHHRTKPRDNGNLRAMSASLAATLIIFMTSTMAISVPMKVDVAQLDPSNVCHLAGLSTLPNICEHIFGSMN